MEDAQFLCDFPGNELHFDDGSFVVATQAPAFREIISSQEMEKTLMRSNWQLSSLASAAIFLFSTAGVLAQEQADSLTSGEYLDVEQGDVLKPASEKAFGTVDETAVTRFAVTFSPYRQSDVPLMDADGTLRYCTSDCVLIGAVALPTGVEVTGLTLDYQDINVSGGVTASLLPCQVNATTCSPIADVISNNDGNGTVFSSASHTVDSLNNSYIMQLAINGGTSDYGARNVTVHYRRQVSPAPGTATFGDVPTGHPFFQHVEALVASGITAGCGGDDYCPDDPVTRGQMAVFLASALGLHWPD